MSYYLDTLIMKLPDFRFEKRIWKKGFKVVAGCDEVGRGAIAGPVVAGCVVFDREKVSGARFKVEDEKVSINDSKKLTQKQREKAYPWIKGNCLTYGIGKVSAKEIDKTGIVKATEKAFRCAIVSANKKLGKSIEYLLVDAFYLPYVKGIPMARKRFRKGMLSNGKNDVKSRQTAIVNGDEKSFSIASASIVAKVFRDNLMTILGENPKYKKYGWDHNKGYGTIKHRQCTVKTGLSAHHRRSFTF